MYKQAFRREIMVVRDIVSLSLDDETLAIWKQIPPKQRSAKIKEYLRTLSKEANLQTANLILEPRRVVKDGYQETTDLLANLPKTPKEHTKRPVFQKRRSTGAL